MIKALWQHKAFISGSIRRDLQAQYWRSLLGSAWLVLSPLAMVFIYTVVFGNVMRQKLNITGPLAEDAFAYGIYLMSGLLAWNYFVDVLQRCTGMFVANGNLLKKAAFPRTSLPLISFGVATVNFLIIWGLFLLFLGLTGRWPGVQMLAYVPLLLLQGAMALGLGTLLGTLNVFYRDINQMLFVGLQFWFWLTPIVYPEAILPDWARSIVYGYNPMASVVAAYHNIVLYQHWPTMVELKLPLLFAASVLALAWLGFRRLSPEIVDEL